MNTKKIQLFGRQITLSERYALDVLSPVFSNSENGKEKTETEQIIENTYFACKMISDGIKAGFNKKFFGWLRAKYYSPKRIYRKCSIKEIQNLLDLLLYELEGNQKQPEESKKKQGILSQELSAIN